MMDLPELIILDVGHGNCAILRDTDAVTVIDCPPTAILFETIDYLGIDVIDHILISHADFDHASGLPALLSRVAVRNVYVNPDADKRSKAWKEIREALGLADKKGTNVHVSLTSQLSRKIRSGQVEIEILAPSLQMALSGSGGEDPKGRSLTSKSMSAVIGLIHASRRIALLTGDIDEVGLDNLLKEHTDIEAQILVFPHHGGNPGKADGRDFAQNLCNLVKPELVIFSLDRDRFENPREEIMQGVVSAVPDARVMCTQLSRRCALDVPRTGLPHLTNLPARGLASNSCCGGSISVKMDGKETTYAPLLALHRAFISNKAHIPMPLCLKHLVDMKV